MIKYEEATRTIFVSMLNCVGCSFDINSICSRNVGDFAMLLGIQQSQIVTYCRTQSMENANFLGNQMHTGNIMQCTTIIGKQIGMCGLLIHIGRVGLTSHCYIGWFCLEFICFLFTFNFDIRMHEQFMQKLELYKCQPYATWIGHFKAFVFTPKSFACTV